MDKWVRTYDWGNAQNGRVKLTKNESELVGILRIGDWRDGFKDIAILESVVPDSSGRYTIEVGGASVLVGLPGTWKLFVENKPELPTEPGVYTDNEGDYWVVDSYTRELSLLTTGGNHSKYARASDETNDTEAGSWAEFAPFTKVVA